ncbi:MAG: hypothetical protein Q4G48_00995 [Bacteroidia bacterium]|nr:hypothetical protein [Bacteroidia bacterium]
MQIVYREEVELYLSDLIAILYEKEYVGFSESAQIYVQKLRKEIEKALPIAIRKKAPDYFSRYGKDMWYIHVRTNSRTTWYAFFSLLPNDLYIVRHITNNHAAGHLIRS